MNAEDAERIRQAKDGDVVRITDPSGLVDFCDQGKIPVPRDQLMQLIELAEDSIYTSESEFSSPPTDEQRDLMLSLYRLVGKEVPPFFARNFGWKLEAPADG